MEENKIEVFISAEFGAVRILKTDDEKVLFCGADVAKALGYSNAPDAISKHCKKDGIAKCDSVDSLGRKNILSFITEGNLYRLITHSKLPNAEKFEAWVFDEVLPTIRKHGAYMTENTLEKALTSPDFLIQLAMNLKEEQAKRKALEIKVEEDKPKVIFADAVSASKTSILVGELAKLINQNGVEIGANRLFEWLRNNGYLISRKGSDRNTGYRNTGDCNAGNFNTGDRNTGNFNSCSFSSGLFNSVTPPVYAFNKPLGISVQSFMECRGVQTLIRNFSMTKWVDVRKMSDEEKEKYTECECTGDYLKILDYKTVFRDLWKKLRTEEKQAVCEIPNFDPAVFEEITGIDVTEEVDDNA